MQEQIQYHIINPTDPLFPYVWYFWQIDNRNGGEQEVVILPDGCFDIIFHTSGKDNFRGIMAGLTTEADKSTIDANTLMFGIGFKLPAAEYLFRKPIAELLDTVAVLPENFWDIHFEEIADFSMLCNKVYEHLTVLRPDETEDKKMKLFQAIYTSEGDLSVADIAAQLHWNSRQINRYFTSWFGLSLKAYCNILRYRASFKQIKEGKLFPEQNFTDQAHFIKTVRKYSGVTPKELAKNNGDRFIQFSRLP